MTRSLWLIDSVRPAFLEATHRWLLPGVSCPDCGRTWTKIGPAVPSVSLTGLPRENEFRNGPIPLEKWRGLQEIVSSLLPPSEPAVPGIALGPLSGAVERPFRLGFIGGWGLVMAESLKSELKAIAPDMRLIPCQISNAASTTYLELEILSGGMLAMSSELLCKSCGASRHKYSESNPTIRDPPSAPLFRLCDRPAQIVADERILPFLQRELGKFAGVRPIAASDK